MEGYGEERKTNTNPNKKKNVLRLIIDTHLYVLQETPSKLNPDETR